MDKKLKSAWIGALCSGRFRQAKGALKSSDGYCCLGVLREIAGVETYGNSYLESTLGEYILLPDDVQRALSTLNDDAVPFEIIASLVVEAL